MWLNHRKSSKKGTLKNPAANQRVTSNGDINAKIDKP